jgi:CheY-like chemotaxis protein
MGDSSNLFRRALMSRVPTLPEKPVATPPPSVEDEQRRRANERRRALGRTLPTLPEEPVRIEVSMPQPARPSTRTRQRCALVVEDDHAIRAGLACVLDDLGWRVVETPTLDGARLVLDGLRPDVLVLDFNLSGEYASVLLDELRYMRRMGPTVIVSASPLAIDAARTHGLELLQKPFGIDAFIAMVERVSSPACAARNSSLLTGHDDVAKARR